tara:strand:+ start:251 stop:688 length:438 start_codon:yes stop_codon:yes gene_type:complete
MNSHQQQQLKNDIQKWYNLDKNAEELHLKLTRIREMRHSIEQKILHTMDRHQLKNKKLNIGPCSIVYSQTLQLPSYNHEIIESGISSLFPKQSNECKKIIQSIERERNTRRKPVLSLKKRKNSSSKSKHSHKKKKSLETTLSNYS